MVLKCCEEEGLRAAQKWEYGESEKEEEKLLHGAENKVRKTHK